MGDAIAGSILLGLSIAIIITVLVNGTQKAIEFVRERRNNGRNH